MNKLLPTLRTHEPLDDQVNGVDELPLGGFFELEMPATQNGYHSLQNGYHSFQNGYHANACALSTGRSCLLAILKYLQPTRCYVPHYTCDAAIAPFRQQNIELVFYALSDDFQPLIRPVLKPGECFLLTNYFGLQRALSASFSEQYGNQLIVDDTHDYFSQGRYPNSWSFTSARKFFGVPDGAFLYPPSGINENQFISAATPPFTNISIKHLELRKRRRQRDAFVQFQAYERSLPCAIFRISEYSCALLNSLDVKSSEKRRQANFRQISDQLDPFNQIKIEFPNDVTPFAYPFLPIEPLLPRQFHQRQIFVPTLWPDILQRAGVDCSVANRMSRELLPFPIDHRYGPVEIQRIVETLLELRSEQ